MTADRDLQEKVLQALEWEPGVDAAEVGVSVDDGVVTLRGEVGTLREKWLAERPRATCTACAPSPTTSR